MKPAPFEYQAPATRREAIDLLASEATVIAGGQSLIPVSPSGWRRRAYWSICDGCPGSARIGVDNSGVRLGARVRGRDIEDNRRLETAFRKHHALQCGFCTPGMLTTAHALLTAEPDADADRIRSVLSGDLCRCTGYIPIVEAVLEARAAYRKTGKP
jgi:hypothetical protein